MSTVLAIDLGTSSCRSAVINEQLKILSISSSKYPLIHISTSQIEQDPAKWWNSVKYTMADAISRAGIEGHSVDAISVSTQGISLLPVNQSGEPLYNAISWLDTRADNQTKFIESKYSFEDLYRLTGKRSSSSYTLPKMLWFKQKYPDIYEKTYKFLLPLDYLLLKLSGNFCTDHSVASGSMYYDVLHQQWANQLLDDFNLDVKKLPEIYWSGTPIGRILPALAKELEISQNAIVVVGGQDQKCAALGASIHEGAVTISLGTASCIAKLSAHIPVDPKYRIPFFSYFDSKHWISEGIINFCSPCYDWFRKTIMPSMSFNQLDELMANSPQNTDAPVFFYPYFGGASSPHWIPTARSTFTGMSLTTSVGQLTRSVLEGIAFNIRANLEAMSEIEYPVRELRVYGGGSNSSFYTQLIANVTNIPVITLSSSETALIGAALLAFKGLKRDLEIGDSTIKESFFPVKASVEMYEQFYQNYEADRTKLFK